MSHRISVERAMELDEKNQRLRELQKQGKPLPRSNRCRKKYLARVRRTEGFIAYLKARGGYKEEKKKEGDVG